MADLGIRELVIAGWTGRDEQALRKHIKELEEVGVKPPKTTPIFYRVAASLLTNADEVQVSGPDTSGEVEFVLLQRESGLFVTVGSDHTDRKAETINVSLSKQLCAKPIARDAWRYDEVKAHWEKLTLRSFIIENSKRTLYQEGQVSAMRSPEDLMQRYGGSSGNLRPGFAMFGGTFAAKGGIRPAERFIMELEDPVLKRRIAHEYAIRVLPVEG
ncbi:MAG TPA: DUF2848 domain-containing protein [Burkholderiales bacterium]|nr:DUF2848 domain-containing protein [Burkholderiales bacterium]